jgi:copper homeostasis protein
MLVNTPLARRFCRSVAAWPTARRLIERLDQAVRARHPAQDRRAHHRARPVRCGARIDRRGLAGSEKAGRRTCLTLITLEVCVDNVHGLVAGACGWRRPHRIVQRAGDRRPDAEPRAAARGVKQPGAGGGHDPSARRRLLLRRSRKSQLMLMEIDAVADGRPARRGAGRLAAGRLAGSAHPGTAGAPCHGPGLRCTLHRAIDLCPDLAQATRLAVDLGFERILTFGRAPSAHRRPGRAAALLRRHCRPHRHHVGRRHQRRQRAHLLRAALPLTDVHASCSEPLSGVIAANTGFRLRYRRPPPDQQLLKSPP